MVEIVEALEPKQIASLIEEQAIKIATLTELLIELRVGGSFARADQKTRDAIRKIDVMLGPEIGESVLKSLTGNNVRLLKAEARSR